MNNFASENRIAEIAAMIGDVSRSAILCTLMDGRAFTAGELASYASVSAQTASGHLAKLMEAGLISVAQQGRHRYYRIASADVADVIESLAVLAAAGPKSFRLPGPKDKAMRLARSCYDHLAGQLAVSVAVTLEKRGFLSLQDGSATVSAEGRKYFCDFGLALDRDAPKRRVFCRACLDWSERRFHIGGQLGAELMDRLIELNWLKRGPQSRTLIVTRSGEAGFAREFGIGQAEDMV
jgi:DNA-binding transcriptional ArsR family regulator